MSRGMKLLVDPNFPNHKKVRALGRALKIHPMQAAGHILALWGRVMLECPSGDIRAWDAHDIADAAKWEGDAKAFVQILRSREIRLLDRYEIHDWIEEQGDVIAKRAQWAKERAERRAREKAKREAEERAREAAEKTSAGDTSNVRADKKPDKADVRGGQNVKKTSGADKGHVRDTHPVPSRPIPSPPRGGNDASTHDTGASTRIEQAPPPPPSAEATPAKTGDQQAPTALEIAEEYRKYDRTVPVENCLNHIEAALHRGVDRGEAFRAVGRIKGKLWDILDALPGNGHGPLAFKPSAPAPKKCRRCGGDGQVVDHAKTELGGTTIFKPCSDCKPAEVKP